MGQQRTQKPPGTHRQEQPLRRLPHRTPHPRLGRVIVALEPIRRTPIRRTIALRRRWRRVVTVLLTLAILAGILLAVLWWSAGLRPSWWSPIDQASPLLRDRATRLENGAVTLMYGGDPATAPANTPVSTPAPGPRRFTALVTADDAQAWLNTKLPEWAVAAGHLRRWPAEVSDLTIRFENDQLLLGARLQTNGGERFLAAHLTPRIDDSGQLWITAQSVSIGRLTLPAGLVLPSAMPPSAAAEPAATGLMNALAGRAPLAVRPTLKLAGSQSLQLRAISVQDGNLLLDCEVEPAPTR